MDKPEIEYSRKKNLMLISPEFGSGGSERSIANLSNLLSPYYNIYFVLFNDKEINYYKYSGELCYLNVAGGRFFIDKAINFIRRIIKLRKLKKKHSIRISISFLEGGDYINILSKRKDKIILSIRGSKKYDKNIKGLLGVLRNNILIPVLYKRADHIVTVAEGIKEELRSIYLIPQKVPITVINNFYEPIQLKQMGEEKLPDEQEIFFKNNFVLISVGRLSHEKGFHFLPEIISGLKNLKIPIKLLLVGDGDFRKSIANQCKKYSLDYCIVNNGNWDFSNDVIFAGYQSNPYSFLSRSKILLLPSLTEGFPNVLLEGMSLGIPVMASDCPYGPKEILSPGNKKTEDLKKEYGMLLPIPQGSDNIRYWINALQTCVENQSILAHYSTKSFERANQYSKEDALKKWKTVINS